MNLLILAEGYPHAGSFAGAFHVDQFRLLAENGISVTVVAPVPWVPPGLERLRPSWRTFRDAPVREHPWPGLAVHRPRYLTVPGEHRWNLAHLFKARAVRRLHKNLGLPHPDLVQAFFALPTGAAARTLALDWKVPYVVTMLGDDVTVLPHLGARHKALFTRVLKDSALAIANGPSLAREAEALAGHPVRALSIGADAGRFSALPDKVEARHRLGLPEAPFIVLYLGRLHREKGVHELAEALTLLDGKDYLGVFVGDGPERAFLSDRPDLRLEGPRPAADVPLYMAAADVMVLPSHHEGLPTTVVEAGLAGLPVIASDIPPHQDLLGDGRGVIAPLHAPPALAGAITRTKAEPEDTAAKAKALNAHVHAHYEVHTTTRRLIGLYREVLGRP